MRKAPQAIVPIDTDQKAPALAEARDAEVQPVREPSVRVAQTLAAALAEAIQKEEWTSLSAILCGVTRDPEVKARLSTAVLRAIEDDSAPGNFSGPRVQTLCAVLDLFGLDIVLTHGRDTRRGLA